MNATRVCLAALVCLAGWTTSAQAQYYACSPALQRPLGQAPDACGPGFYYIDCYGIVWGPNYCLYPCFPPVQGVAPWHQLHAGGQGMQGAMPARPPMPGMPPMPGQPPTAGGANGIPSFPSHPFARGPRDFFMWNEVQAERFARERRPNIVP